MSRREIELFGANPGLIKSTGSEIDVPKRSRPSILAEVSRRFMKDLDDAEHNLRSIVFGGLLRPVRDGVANFTDQISARGGGPHETIAYFMVNPTEDLPPTLYEIGQMLDRSGRTEELHIHAIARKNGGIKLFIAPHTLHREFLTKGGSLVADPQPHYRNGSYDVFIGAEERYDLPHDQVGLLIDVAGGVQNSRLDYKLLGSVGYRSKSIAFKPRQDVQALFNNPLTAQRVAAELLQDTVALLTNTVETREGSNTWKNLAENHKAQFKSAQEEFERLYRDGKKHFVEIAAEPDALTPELSAVCDDLGIVNPERPQGSAYIVYQRINNDPVITLCPEALTRDNAQLQIRRGYKSGSNLWEVKALTSDPVPSNFVLPDVYTKDLQGDNLFYEQLFVQLVGIGKMASEPEQLQTPQPKGEIENL